MANHFVGVNFVAPWPAYSDFLIRNSRLDYWSLSIEESGPRSWHPAQILLFGMWILVLLPAALVFARVDRRFLAPGLCIASQFGLHLVYGREYILYSPNWHGVVVACLVAAAWNGLRARRRWMAPVVAVFCVAVAVNNLAVLNRVYQEVDAGLEKVHRDASGRLLSPRGPGIERAIEALR